jgi:exosortase A
VHPLWRVLPGVLLLAVLLVLFRDTAQAMVGIWTRSETFAHAFLVPPIVLWLVWRRRAELAMARPRPAPWLLVPIALVCLLWVLGGLAALNSVTQFALVLLIVLAVPAVFGFDVARTITFPLLFLFFAVPVGEFMVPYMMEWTADFTVLALSASGIPVYREGLQFVIPSGNWSVVEACSGVRYLIASFMVGSLFAYLNYRSSMRRALFMVVSLLVPIVANWLRAYLTVMLGHFSDNKLAVGADHLIYGWVFFGLVVGVMFLIGSRWAEPDAPAPVPALGKGSPGSPGLDVRTWGVALSAAVLLTATQAVMWRLEHEPTHAAPVLNLPAMLEGGWVAGPGSVADWTPAYANASGTMQAVYRSGETRIGVWVGYYRDQGYERKLVTSTNMLVDQTSAQWAQLEHGSAALAPGSASGRVSTALLRQPADPKSNPTMKLAVAQVYWVGGRFTASDALAKLLLAVNRLLGRGDDSAVVIFYAPLDEQGRVVGALNQFASQHLGHFGESLTATAARAARP